MAESNPHVGKPSFPVKGPQERLTVRNRPINTQNPTRIRPWYLSAPNPNLGPRRRSVVCETADVHWFDSDRSREPREINADYLWEKRVQFPEQVLESVKCCVLKISREEVRVFN
jgi:hypothetical protein